MITITEKPDGSRTVQIGSGPNIGAIALPMLAGILAAAVPAQATAESHTPQSRFIKLSASGEHLPADAPNWAAIQDTKHGLIWSAEHVGGDRLTYSEAEAACSKLQLAGATDWRLPTRPELESLLDLTRHKPAIDTQFFPNTDSDYWYWTSTPCAWRSGASWCVDFGYGGVYDYDLDGRCFVRAVRSVPPAPGQ